MSDGRLRLQKVRSFERHLYDTRSFAILVPMSRWHLAAQSIAPDRLALDNDLFPKTAARAALRKVTTRNRDRVVISDDRGRDAVALQPARGVENSVERLVKRRSGVVSETPLTTPKRRVLTF